jgi:hypothetical protein
MFPGAGARIYYSDEGEPIGYDYPDYDSLPDPPGFDPFDPDDEDLLNAIAEEAGDPQYHNPPASG